MTSPEIDKLRDEGLSLLQTVTHLHTEIVTYVARVKKVLTENDPGGLTDLCYLLRKTEDIVDGSRKELANAKDMTAATVGAMHTVAAVKALQEGLTPNKSVIGRLAVGTPRSTVVANLPAKQSDDMVKLVSALMQDYPTAKDIVDADVLRIHWPSLVEILTKRQEEGLTPLPGIDPSTVKSRHTLVCRERSQVQ